MKISALVLIGLVLATMVVGSGVVGADDSSSAPSEQNLYASYGGDQLDTPCDRGDSCWMWYLGYCWYVC